MRTIVASADSQATAWLQGVLTSAGLSVAVVSRASPGAPELLGCDLLIADRASSETIGDSGPRRRMLLVSRGAVVDVSTALGAGFMDVIVVPSPEEEILGRVGRALDGLLRPVRGGAEPRARSADLKQIVRRVDTALRQAGRESRTAAHEVAHGMLSVFLLMIDSHESADRGAPGHSRRAATLARRMAAHAGLQSEPMAWLELAARLQDIGLLALRLPLSGSAPLSGALRGTLAEHSKISADILHALREWGLPVDAIRMHHERIDGSGYPDGVSDVPVQAQILGCADVYEALTSRRPWRQAASREDALSAMRLGGTFSPDVLALLESSLGLDLASASRMPEVRPFA